ncbi:MAG TPA: tetratricopeptide repeat protein [Terriglobia bacterium]|nr:tetratricopeptide repeat protein [Terriglobia bacterium]
MNRGQGRAAVRDCVAALIAASVFITLPVAGQDQEMGRSLGCFMAGGINAFEHGDLALAEREFRGAVEASSGNPEARENLAMTLAREAKLDEAVAELKQVLAVRPDWTEANYNLGRVLLEKNDLEAAEYEFSTAASQGSAEAQVRLGAVLGEEDRLAEALQAQRKAVELLPDDAEAHFLLGGGLQESGDLAGTAREFREAAKLQPGRMDAQLNLGIALRQMGDLPGALDGLQSAQKLADSSTDVHYQLGSTLRRMGKLAEAEAELRRSISLEPKNAQSYYLLGQTLEQMGRHPEAASAFAEVERLHHASAIYAQAVTQYNLGMEKLEKGDLNASREALMAAISLWPDLAQAHTNLGGVLLKLGDVKGAIGQLRSAIDLNPDEARAYFNLSLALTSAGDAEGAKVALARARQLDPQIASSSNQSSP